jgi:hypothetical protein
MNPQPENPLAPKNPATTGETESTLRLIAGLHAPEGLETRVKAALHRAPAPGKAATLLGWPVGPHRAWLHSTMQSTWVRSAAAAAIVCVVAGGSWGVYQHVQPREAPVALPHFGTGGFSTASAMRTPKTLDGPTLTHPVLTPSLKAAGGQRAGLEKERPGAKKKAAGKAAVAKPAAQ